MSEAAAEATPDPEPEGGDTTVVVAVDGGGPDPEPEGDTTVVVVENADDEGAQDDATALDHEQRITRLEERVQQVANDVAERPTWEAVQSMTPSVSEVIDTAAAVAAEVAEDIAEDEDDQADDEVERVEEAPDVVAVDPQSPAVSDAEKPRRRGLFTW